MEHLIRCKPQAHTFGRPALLTSCGSSRGSAGSRAGCVPGTKTTCPQVGLTPKTLLYIVSSFFYDFLQQDLILQLPSHLKANCQASMCFCLMLTYICDESSPHSGNAAGHLEIQFPQNYFAPCHT